MNVTNQSFSIKKFYSILQKWNWWVLTIIGIILLSLLILFWPRISTGSGLTDAQIEIPVMDIQALSPDQVADILIRREMGPNEVELDILYAPTWYFEWNDRILPNSDGPALAFFVMETIHENELGDQLPFPLLWVEGAQIEPIAMNVVSTAPHHRVMQVVYSAVDENGNLLVTDQSENLTLVIPSAGNILTDIDFIWELPLPNGLGLINADVPAAAIGASPVGNVVSSITWPAFVAIMGGMFVALSPCLLQLAAYYVAVLAGAGSEPGKLTQARKHLVNTGGFFVGGFTLVYTTGGAIAGYVGGSLQELEFVQQWSRPISMVAGIIIIWLAFRIAVQARAPLICKLPIRINSSSKSGWVSSALMGSSFAVGCLSCFSATVLSALLVYAGSTGSPLIGGLLLFLFSVAVGIVFLLGAWALGKAAPMLDWLHRAQPVIGGISALIMLGFGLLMVTYKFHLVSGYLFQAFSVN